MAKWYHRACLRHIEEGDRERALECAEAIRRLPNPLHLALAAELEAAINGTNKTYQN